MAKVNLMAGIQTISGKAASVSSGYYPDKNPLKPCPNAGHVLCRI